MLLYGILLVVNCHNSMYYEHLKSPSKFNGDNVILIEDHMMAFQDCTINFIVKENVVFNKILT